MKYKKPSVKLMFITPNALKLIELAGRECYKSESKITKTSAEPFVRKIIESGHESVLEHAHATFRILCDRGVSHEYVRHRIASYSQESTRYCNYNKVGKDISIIMPAGLTPKQVSRRKNLFKQIEQIYNAEIDEGISPQIARGVLPTCLKTELIVTMNFRSLRNFLKLRLSKKAHPQIIEIAKYIHEIISSKYKVIVEDI